MTLRTFTKAAVMQRYATKRQQLIGTKKVSMVRKQHGTSVDPSHPINSWCRVHRANNPI